MAALFRVKALYEYSSPHEDDLNFPAGQIIAVTDDEDADWYGGEYVDEAGAKKEGIFPRNFVEKFEPVAPPRPVRKQKQEPEAAAPAAPPPPPEASAPEDTAGRSTPPPAIPGGVASLPSPKRVVEPVRHTQPAEAPAPPVPAPVPVAAPAPPPVASPPAPAPVPLPTSPKRTESPASAASSAPKPKPAPPPVSEKPSSFKDRIAAFNKSAAPPIAPFKPSGLGGSGSGFIKKPFVAPPPSRNAYVPPVREAPAAKVYRREEDPEIKDQVAETQGQAAKAGLVPTESQKEGDEEDQPKPTSLKERIALLQKQQMEQAQRHADAASKKEKPKKPPPPKKRVDSQVSVPEAEEAPAVLDRRSIDEPPVRASMDGAPSENAPLALRPQPELNVSSRPVSRDTANEVKDDTAEADVDDRASHRLSKIPTSSTTGGAAPAHEIDQPAAEPQETVEEETEQEEQETQEEEEEEEEVDPEVRRKEELRARMAKMSGGMGFHGMFGPPLGGGLPPRGPKPPVRSATTREEDVTPPPHAPPVPAMIPIPGMMAVPVKPAEEAAPAEEPETEQAPQKPDEEGDSTPPAAAPEHAEEGESISIKHIVLNLLILGPLILFYSPSGA